MANKFSDKKIKPFKPVTTEKAPAQQVPVPVSVPKKTNTPSKK